MKKKKIIVLAICMAFVSGFVAIIHAQEKEDEINIKFDKDLPRLAAEINKHCPYMLDTATRLDSAVGDTSNNFAYHFTLVAQTLSELDLPKLKTDYKTNIVRFVRSHPDMAGFIENKVTLFYFYKDKAGEFVAEIKVSPEDYLKEK